jgi:hypothetical protein
LTQVPAAQVECSAHQAVMTGRWKRREIKTEEARGERAPKRQSPRLQGLKRGPGNRIRISGWRVHLGKSWARAMSRQRPEPPGEPGCGLASFGGARGPTLAKIARELTAPRSSAR